MNVPKLEGKRLILLSLLLVLALFVAACGQDEPEVVVAPAGEEAAVVEQEAAVVEEEAAVDEVDAVATTVITDTIVDTNVITQIEVITQTDVAEVEVVTEVITDTDVTVNTASDTESDVTTITESVTTGQNFTIIVLSDAAGNQFLGDALGQHPVFASEGTAAITDPRFEPIQAGEGAVYGEGVNQALFGEVDQNGIRQLTYNNRPLYRFTGEASEDWRTSATELGLSPLTATGEPGEFAE